MCFGSFAFSMDKTHDTLQLWKGKTKMCKWPTLFTVKPIPTHLGASDMKPMQGGQVAFKSLEPPDLYSITLKGTELPYSLGLYARDYSSDLILK